MLKRFLLLLTLLVAPAAYAQTGFFYQLDPPAPNATLTVCVLPSPGPSPTPCTALFSAASLFSDAALTVPATNPVTLGPSGNYGFWVAAGQYTIQLSGPVSRNFVVTLGGGSGGAGTLPRLDQVLDQNTAKSFNQGSAILSFGNGPGLDLSTETSPARLPNVVSCAPSLNGQVCFDSLNYVGFNGALSMFGVYDPTLIADGDIVGFKIAGGKYTLQDLGPVNGTGGNTFIRAVITNIQEGDSICYDSASGFFVNCTEGVPVTTISGTTYTVDCSTDRGSYLLFTSTSPIAVTLPQATNGSNNCDASFFTYIRTLAATLTVTPTTSTINDGGGASATLVISPGYGTNIFSDNSNYVAKVSPYREGSNPLLEIDGYDVGATGRYQWQEANSGTATVLNKAVCLASVNTAKVCPAASSTTNNPDGFATVGVGAAPGATGNTSVCSFGYCPVFFDNTATAGHYAQLSSSVDGDLSDTGSTTPPTNGQAYWYIWSSNSGANTVGVVRIATSNELNAAGNNGAGKTTVQINGVSTKPQANFTNSGTVTFSKVDVGNTSTITATASGSGGYATIQSNGAAITQRPTVNFIPAGSANVSCVDNPGATKSDCTVTGINGPPSPTVNYIAGTTYTIQNSDNSWRDAFTSTNTVAVTLPQANTISVAPFVAQRYNNTVSSCTSCSTSAFAQNAGDTLSVIIYANPNANNGGITSVTDTAGDTCILNVPSQLPPGGFNAGLTVYSCSNIAASGANTLTVHTTSTSTLGISVVEYIAAASSFDHGAGTNGLDNTTLSVTIPLTATNEVVVGAGNPSNCPSGWVDRGNVVGAVKLCEKLVSSQSTSTFSQVAYGGGGNGYSIIEAGYAITASPVFTAGWFVVLENQNSPLVTVTPTTSQIRVDGVLKTTLTIAKGRSCVIMSDGVNYDATCWGSTLNLTTAIHQTAQTGAISTATLCAASPGACDVAGQYHVHWDFIETGTACSNVTAGSVTFLLTWTDTNGTAHSAVVVPMLNQTGATSVAQGNSFTFATALANAGASGDFNISTNGTVIQYATGYTGCTTGTGTYQLDAIVTKLQY